jgi:hypothetical protein
MIWDVSWGPKRRRALAFKFSSSHIICFMLIWIETRTECQVWHPVSAAVDSGGSTKYIFFCKRAILFLSSSKILTPHPPLRPASVYPAGRRGGWGRIFWKTKEIGLPSYSKICTLWVGAWDKLPRDIFGTGAHLLGNKSAIRETPLSVTPPPPPPIPPSLPTNSMSRVFLSLYRKVVVSFLFFCLSVSLTSRWKFSTNV